MATFAVDISNHQNGFALRHAKAAGAEAAILKATEGHTYRDPTFHSHLADARHNGMIVAAYLYVWHNSTPAQMAETFAHHVNDTSIPVILDVENNSGRSVTQWRETIAELAKRGYHSPLLYIPHWYWTQIGRPDLSGLPPLWTSNYPAGGGEMRDTYARAGGDNGPGWAGYGGLDVALWQFTEKAQIGGRPIDANAFRGSREELAALLGGGGTPAPTTPKPERTTVEKRLDYPRDEVHQDTGWNCGPASAQTIIRAATDRLIPESTLARELGTHTGGTDYIGQFPSVLNRYIPDGGYRYTSMPNDPPTGPQRDDLWEKIVGSIDAGLGVVANIVSPPSNRPRPSYTSTQPLQYTGGTVYHYVAVMGYAVDGSGTRHVWIADSGFRPYGSWITLDNLATLIPPKGFAYPTKRVEAPAPAPEEKETEDMGILEQRFPGFVDPEIDGTIPDWVRHADRNSFNALVEIRALRAEVAALRQEIKEGR